MWWWAGGIWSGAAVYRYTRGLLAALGKCFIEGEALSVLAGEALAGEGFTQRHALRSGVGVLPSLGEASVRFRRSI